MTPKPLRKKVIRPILMRLQEEKSVTIGIGVLCSTKPKPHTPRPDSAVIIADTMGSTSTDSTGELHKIWINDDLRFYACGAGDLDTCGELISIVENELPKETTAAGRKTHSVINTVLAKSFHILRSQHFQYDVFPNLSIFKVGQIVTPDRLVEEWQKFSLNLAMLFAFFDETEQTYLYQVGSMWNEDGNLSSKTVQLCEMPGCRAIGSGEANASFWLNFRGQFLGLSVRQSAYHAYEAKRMAAKAPTVNDSVEIVIALPEGKSYHLTRERPSINGCPISLAELEKMFAKYGPKNTLKDLGHRLSMPSTSRRSKREP